MPIRDWTIRPEPVHSPVAGALLRDYYAEIVSRYHRRPVDDTELDQVLAEESSADLAPPTGLFLVGWYDGEPAGCAGVRLGALPYAEVTRVFVRPAARRRGGAVRLLAALEEVAAAHGATTMRLDTRTDLVEARALYARQGYREVPPYTEDPYADHWFEKHLPAATGVRVDPVDVPIPRG
ncbi:GNAT family N-acetyltransferase [Micromonospora sp. WMMD1102]|uniref:GNAT family N-acetyltransferase n=1 Tax=Micromonospora sp. WMMD1102 TaxID=3016105 RepID=UPI0024151BA4|nr:GNAT family N-acetyltransferase [Micromonospora sp. WMMD1102]MDG4787073.1 GNAT family N-acetyltransferase [Micromonospora sp. WMMD1102]